MNHRWTGLAASLALVCALGAVPARGEDAAAAPADPTRGGWDGFLDPLRDFEDNYVSAGQKWVEDRTKIHIAAGFTEAYTWDFNKPRAGSLITLHSLEHHNDGVPSLGQLDFARPSDGWFTPGFDLKLDAGKVARDIKSDWNGDGGVNHGDTFETKDFDVQQAYLQWTVPADSPALKGLSVKGGKFVTLLGAEVIEPWANYNYSRSYMFSFAIPFSHTGVLLSYPLTDKINVTGGAVEGWDKVASNNNGWSGIGEITWVPNDMWALTANGIWGPEQSHTTSNKRGVADFVVTLKPTTNWTFLMNYDYGHEEGAAVVGSDKAATWQGFAEVANYAFTDRLSAAARGEWFNDHGGSRTGTSTTYLEGTLTGKYLITQHLYGQIEYRHDEAYKKVFPADNRLTPLHGQDIVGFDVTYLFQ